MRSPFFVYRYRQMQIVSESPEPKPYIDYSLALAKALRWVAANRLSDLFLIEI